MGHTNLDLQRVLRLAGIQHVPGAVPHSGKLTCHLALKLLLHYKQVIDISKSYILVSSGAKYTIAHGYGHKAAQWSASALYITAIVPVYTPLLLLS